MGVTGIPEAVAAVATMLTKVFGFVVDPDKLATMEREHEIEVINAGIRIAIKKKDVDAIDLLFTRYRELSART